MGIVIKKRHKLKVFTCLALSVFVSVVLLDSVDYVVANVQVAPAQASSDGGARAVAQRLFDEQIPSFLIEAAYKECAQFGLGAMDALHISAAFSVGAVEFLTYEKPEKSIFRTKSIQVISIFPKSN